jgi:RNA polymerase sigma factor (TIGR02999 family)
VRVFIAQVAEKRPLLTSGGQILPNGIGFTGEGKLVRKATAYEQEKAEAVRHRASGWRAARAELPARPLERIGDPPVFPTRHNSFVESLPSSEITVLLKAWAAGDHDAFDRLAPLVYDDLRRRAGRYMAWENAGNSFQPTALVNEAFLQLIGTGAIDWHDRAHFFAVCSQMMRRILVSAARARNSGKRGGGAVKLDLNESIDAMPDRGRALIVLDDALSELGRFDSRKAQVVEMRFFGGLSHQEIADVLHVSEPTVRRDWALARSWLMQQMS